MVRLKIWGKFILIGIFFLVSNFLLNFQAIAQSIPFINFNNSAVLPASGNQDNGIYEIQDNGATLYITNNAWKAVEINYNIQSNTILQFDFKSTIEGEAHGIGFNSSSASGFPAHVLDIYGTQTDAPDNIPSDDYTSNGNWQTFSVDIGSFITGNYPYLVFITDDDASATGNSFFRNVKLFEPVIQTSVNTNPIINEIGANNATIIADPQGEFDDWIEIYNSSDTLVDLAGYYITDDINNPLKWQIPSSNPAKTTIPANGYLLLWADGQITDGEEHLNFSLSNAGESVYLFATDGTTLIDNLNYPALSSDVSYGRSTDGNIQQVYFFPPSPLAANDNSVDAVILFSEPSQTFISTLYVSLSTTANNGLIRYTTDGSEPTTNSSVYAGAVTVANDAVLKAKFFFSNGVISSTFTERYAKMSGDMTNISSDLPIILIDTYNQTLDPNVMKNTFWSLIEPNNNGRAYATDTSSFSGKVGMKIRGGSSESFAKKQWRLELRNEDDTDRKEKLLGMPSESDWILYAPGKYDRALINNALMYELSRKLGKWAPRTRFVEVYINNDGGDISSVDYWGVYMLTENIKIDNNRVDLANLKDVDNTGEELSGGYLFALDRDFSIQTNYTTNYWGSSNVGYEIKNSNGITVPQLSYIENKIIEFENALTSPNWLDPQLGYKNYTDINSWVNNHILKALAKEPDAFRLSQYFYKDKNEKINAGPVWDFDRALNSIDGRSADPLGWDKTELGNTTPYYWPVGISNAQSVNPYTTPYIKEMIYDPDYVTLFADSWFEWRKNNVLKTEEINFIIDSMANVLNEAQVRNITDGAPAMLQGMVDFQEK